MEKVLVLAVTSLVFVALLAAVAGWGRGYSGAMQRTINYEQAVATATAR